MVGPVACRFQVLGAVEPNAAASLLLAQSVSHHGDRLRRGLGRGMGDGQSAANEWPNHGQSAVKAWSNYGQGMVVNTRSNDGQNMVTNVVNISNPLLDCSSTRRSTAGQRVVVNASTPLLDCSATCFRSSPVYMTPTAPLPTQCLHLSHGYSTPPPMYTRRLGHLRRAERPYQLSPAVCS